MADREKIVTRKYQSGDEKKIIDLLELVFDDWPKIDLRCSKLEHWKWKYLDRPFQGLRAVVAFYRDKLIGCIHAPLVNLKVENGVYLCEPGGDLAVHPDYRGLGIWRRMVDLWDEYRKTPYIIGYSNSSTEVILKRVKAHNSLLFPSPVRHYLKIKDLDGFLDVKDIPYSMIKKMGYLGLSSLSKLSQRDIPTTHQDYNIRTITKFDDRIDSFWDFVKDEYKLIVERKRKYLNWRFCDKRGGDYIVRIIEKGNEIIGYSVLRINRYNQEFPEGYIVELLTSRINMEASRALFTDACNFFNENNVGALHYWIPKDHYYTKLIESLGFLDSRKTVVVWFGDTCTPEILQEIREVDKEQVLFQFGDIDWI